MLTISSSFHIHQYVGWIFVLVHLKVIRVSNDLWHVLSCNCGNHVFDIRAKNWSTCLIVARNSGWCTSFASIRNSVVIPTHLLWVWLVNGISCIGIYILIEISILMHPRFDFCLGILVLLVSYQFIIHECIYRWCLTAIHGVDSRVG